jgi:exodeoxyribonuclease V alpha subunit
MLGDPNQLPSIQPGQLLIDLLKVKSIPNIKLDKVQRQKDGLIIDNAYRILKGDINLIFDGVQCTNRNIVDDNELLYYYKNEKSVHIVTLTREESRRINNFMQDKSNNNPAYFYEYYKKYFKLGDKVKQNINNYNKAVFNGEIGIIIDISSTYVEVKYYSKNVLYKYNTCEEYKKHEKNNMKKKRDDIGEIDLAYSTTIHSTQGNEYDVVFIILIGCQFMLNRNIIYTALTRAKKHAIVIGEKKIINYGINKEYIDRPTLLDKRFDPKINLNSYEQTFSKLDSIQKTDSYIFITPDIEDEDNINICASDFNANNYEVIYCKNK